MLGEAAITMLDAKRYFQSYKNAIHTIGKSVKDKKHELNSSPGISIKLSALYPKYHESHRSEVMANLPHDLLELAKIAKEYNIGLTIDAEESERLELYSSYQRCILG